MSYELFRTSVLTSLQETTLAQSQILDVIQEIDRIASQYDIQRRCMDLITVSDLPEVVKMYCAALMVENKAKGTVEGYMRELKKMFQTVRKPFSSFTTNDIRQYLFYRQTHDGLKKTSVEHVRVIVNAFYSWLVNQELIARNPAKLIEPIRIQRVNLPPMQQIELEYFRDACRTEQEKALIDFLVSTGCRAAECAAMQISDINWKERSVVIRHGKGDKRRITYFNPEAEVSVKKYIASRKGDSPYLFVKTRAPYTGITTKAIQDIVAKILHRVSDAVHVKVTPHTFRRTMATHLAENGCPIEDIQALLGHASVNTTMRYVSRNGESVKASYNRYFT